MKPDESRRVQKLSEYRNPPGFRGRSLAFVQLWWIAQACLIHGSPQVMYGWRRMVLRLFGARIGRGVRVRSSVRIVYPWRVSIGDDAWIGDDVSLYSLGEISIGHDAVISQGSYLCTGSHDHHRADFAIFVRPIVIEPEAWIAAFCFLGPGVNVGKGAVVAARSVVVSDVPALSIFAGHPAKFVGERF
jgi:putative colanic acid biosynthesis acetyltransferase WcaF